MFKNRKLFAGFTLIELLITIGIIGILVTIASFAFNQARQNSRDVRRKADLETIRSGLEMYRSDCGAYPATLPISGSLVGSGICSGNTYINSIPQDPISGRRYYYNRTSNTTYELCAGLETGGSDSCGGGSDNCGSGVGCNYRVINP